MKKVIASFAIILSAAFLLFLNVSTNASNNTGAKESNLSLNNIQALQASAGEWKCDASNTNICCWPGQAPQDCMLSYGNLVYIQ